MLQTSNSQFALTKNAMLKVYRKVYRFCGNSVKTVSASFEHLPFTLMWDALNVLYFFPISFSLCLPALLPRPRKDRSLFPLCILYHLTVSIASCSLLDVNRPRWQLLCNFHPFLPTCPLLLFFPFCHLSSSQSTLFFLNPPL